MSLSDRLRDSKSPVRAFLEGISPHISSLRGTTSSAQVAANSLGLVDLAKSTMLVPAPRGRTSATTGTAFDIRARIALGGFDARISASFAGVSMLIAQSDHIENGRHRATVLSGSFVLAEGILLDAKNDAAQLDLAAVLFAYCEQILRGGVEALNGTLGEACDQAVSAHEFADNVDSGVLADVRALMNAGRAQIDAWQSRIAAGERFEPNPDFAGSLLVDGADGDWFIGETLIDCKVYEQLSIPKLRNFLLQLLGYVMLDLDDALKIRQVGLWLPRQQLTPIWSLESLLGRDPEEVLPRLREEFIKATNPTQIALHIPVTQRRKHQLLADNRHTPSRMLGALANSDDNDIRFRVGRNEMTPEATVRLLATDRYARAREGAAMNERVPADVLKTLSRDSSSAVRRAAALNRGSSWQSANALTSGVSESQSDAVDMNDQPIATADTRASLGVAEINQDRANWSLDTRWLTTFLSSVLHNDLDHQARVRVPEASLMWSYISRRSFQFPERLRDGFPDALKADLFRRDRPAAVRRVVARNLDLSNTAIRDRLLTDEDAEIRWLTLQRSIEDTDDSLAEFLGKLAESREVRLRFRKDKSSSSYCGHTPTELDQQVLQLLAGHRSTPRHALQELIENKQPNVLIALARNTALEPEDREALVHKMIAFSSLAAREVFASSEHTPPEVLQALASDRKAHVRKIVAQSTQVPVETLAALSTDPNREVRLALFRNSVTPGDLAASIAQELLANSTDHELLEILDALTRRMDVELPKAHVEEALDELSKSRVREPDMRYKVGRNTRAGERTLKRLSKSTNDEVRRAVAENTSSPAIVLELLATDPVLDVRSAVAGNPATSVTALTEISQDDDSEVRLAAAQNSNLSQEALEALTTDASPRVRHAASRHPSANTQDVSQSEVERHEKASKSRLTRDDLQEMAAATQAEKRIRVAYQVDAPPDLLKFLAGERRSTKVRRAVAAHPNTPAEVLWSLADDKDFEMHQVVALNSSTPAELLVELAGRSVDFALLVSLNPGAPDEVLDALAADDEALVRFVADARRVHRKLAAGAEIFQLSATTKGAD